MLFQVLKTLGDTLGLQLQLQLQPKVTLVIVMVVAIFASVNASPLVAKGKYLSRRFFLNSRRLVLPRPPPTSSLDTHCTDVIGPEESKEIEKSSSSKLQFVKVKRESSNQKAELIGKLYKVLSLRAWVANKTLMATPLKNIEGSPLANKQLLEG